MSYFTTFDHAYIVTANKDGSIPKDSQIVATLESANKPLLSQLVRQANLWQRHLEGSKK